eukprot:462752-Amphidinium_carterae.1
MRLGCQLGVAESMNVNTSQVMCIVTSQPQATSSDDSRRLSVEILHWNSTFLIKVPDEESADIIEQHLQIYSQNSTEFFAIFERRLLDVSSNETRVRDTLTFGRLHAVPRNSNTIEVELLVWIGYLFGAIRCDEESEVAIVGTIGNATARCFGRHDQEVPDGVACQVGRDGDHSVSVPTTIFNETGKDDYILVVINLNTSLAESFADVYTVGSAMSIALGDEHGMTFVHLESPININFEGLPRIPWECAVWER